MKGTKNLKTFGTQIKAKDQDFLGKENLYLG